MMIYCPLCGKKVEVGTPNIETVETKWGMRNRATGTCPKHKTSVSTFVSLKPKPEVVKKERKPKKQKDWRFWL